jgi:hypothetical protein
LSIPRGNREDTASHPRREALADLAAVQNDLGLTE